MGLRGASFFQGLRQEFWDRVLVSALVFYTFSIETQGSPNSVEVRGGSWGGSWEGSCLRPPKASQKGGSWRVRGGSWGFVGGSWGSWGLWWGFVVFFDFVGFVGFVGGGGGGGVYRLVRQGIIVVE